MKILLISFAAIACYLAAAGWQLRRLMQRVQGHSRMLLLVGGALAVVLHALVLAPKFYTDAGINFGFFNVLSLLGWLMAVMLLAAAWSRPVENLATVIFPLAALTLVLETVLPSHHLLPEDSSLTLRLHILISILSYSLLSVAAVQAMVLAFQDRHLHNKQPGGLIRVLPPLQTMEGLLFQMIGVGFVMVTLSLITGFIYLDDMFAQHVVHKTVLSLIGWLFYAVLLWGRWQFGWRGRRAIRITLSGFGALILAYLGSKLVLELVLGH
ncbi:MAG: cytochrome c biogenesis protein CcsA [Gammaproteobacteria bacterium]|nr:cytochrome c biogenesis protein CcsA [Gammaproteobacteria bacterium]